MIGVEMWRSGPPNWIIKEPWLAVHFSGAHKLRLDQVLIHISYGDPDLFIKDPCSFLRYPPRFIYFGLLDEEAFMYGEERFGETIAAWPLVKDGHTIDFEQFGGRIAEWTRTTREPLQGPNEFKGWGGLMEGEMRAHLLGNKERGG